MAISLKSSRLALACLFHLEHAALPTAVKVLLRICQEFLTATEHRRRFFFCLLECCLLLACPFREPWVSHR
ncbi:hypothetical protein B0H34DRAFT_715485 [Crassisporium funariophilum]|nr:hypothetical protein B0H34DRAFT_715485 [Crassisporium funariophilum]